MTLQMIPRATWGARPWATTVYSVPLTSRTEFVVHYDGDTPITRTGFAIPRAIDDEHHANGWAGIGYNFVISQAGDVYEGRGWDLAGAHCPGHNVIGLGVQVAIGGDQQPTDAALHAADALYAEACARTGRQLRKTWHGANYATDCPGPQLIAWVQAGMPDPTTAPTPLEDPVPPFTPTDLAATWKVSWGDETAEDRLAAAAHGTALTPTLAHLVDLVTAQQATITALSAKVDQLLAAHPAP